jgi:hypothetical protein
MRKHVDNRTARAPGAGRRRPGPSRGWLGRAIPAVLLALTVIPTACSSIDTDVQAAPGIEELAWESYAWAEPIPDAGAEAVVDDPELRRQVRRAVDAELDARGLRKADRATADLLVFQQLGVEEKVRVNDPYYSFWIAELYEEGALVLEFVDPGTNELLWRGVAKSELRTIGRSVGVNSREFVRSDEARDWKLAEKVRAILGKFPSGG